MDKDRQALKRGARVGKIASLLEADLICKEKLIELDAKRNKLSEQSDVFHAKHSTFQKVEKKISELSEKRSEIHRKLSNNFGVTLLP